MGLGSSRAWVRGPTYRPRAAFPACCPGARLPGPAVWGATAAPRRAAKECPLCAACCCHRAAQSRGAWAWGGGWGAAVTVEIARLWVGKGGWWEGGELGAMGVCVQTFPRGRTAEPGPVP